MHSTDLASPILSQAPGLLTHNSPRRVCPRRKMLRGMASACALALLLPSVGFAVMPPWVYEQARETAMYHIQVRVLGVEGPTYRDTKEDTL